MLCKIVLDLDGTVRDISRPGVNQKTVYNGHKKVHALKFQSVVLPNGIIALMYGPVEGKRHDCSMLRMSDLLTKLSLNAWDTNGNPLSLYGDPAYPLRIHLQCQSLFFVTGLRPVTLLKKRLWHRSFYVNFAKFLKTHFFTEHLR